MTTCVTGKLNDSAREFQAGESTGFGFRIGVQYYDRDSKQKEWTNYEGAVFSNNDNQINFLRNNLVKGSVITVTAKTINIKTYNDNHSISLNDCNLDFVFNPDSSGAPANNAPQQQAPQQPAPQQNMQSLIDAFWKVPEGHERNQAWNNLPDNVKDAINSSNK